MGRGRAKAKQTKVARELKYSSPNMDLDRLKTDLGVSNGSSSREGDLRELDEDDDDPYAYDEDEDD